MNEDLLSWVKKQMRQGVLNAKDSAYNDAMLDVINRISGTGPVPDVPPTTAPAAGAQPPPAIPQPPAPEPPPVKDPLQVRNSEAPPWHPFSRLPRGHLEQAAAQLVTATAMCLEQEFGVPASRLALDDQKALFDQFGIRSVAFMDSARNTGSVALYHNFSGWPRLFGAFEVNLATGEARGIYLPEGTWPAIPKK